MNMNGNYHADSLAFLNHPAAPIMAAADLNLDLAHVTVAPPMPLNQKGIMKFVEKSLAEIESQSKLRIIYRSTDIAVAEENQQTAIVMGLQNFPTDGAISALWNAGVRVYQLWYDRANDLGGGFAAPDVGLTDVGKKSLWELANIGAILDLSHAGRASARDVLTYIRKQKLPIKVMASHGGCYGVYEHNRNLPDDIIRDITELQGMVGIYTLTFGLSASDDTLLSFFKHLDHALTTCGDDNLICIGSDGVYQTATEEVLREQYNKLNKLVDPDGIFGVRFPAQPLETYSPKKLNIIDDAMIQADYPETFRRKILGNNLQRFFKTAIAAST
jgi:microsomal dipeptidase-like Zn-dependent dipeptidase